MPLRGERKLKHTFGRHTQRIKPGLNRARGRRKVNKSELAEFKADCRCRKPLHHGDFVRGILGIPMRNNASYAELKFVKRESYAVNLP